VKPLRIFADAKDDVTELEFHPNCNVNLLNFFYKINTFSILLEEEIMRSFISGMYFLVLVFGHFLIKLLPIEGQFEGLKFTFLKNSRHSLNIEFSLWPLFSSSIRSRHNWGLGFSTTTSFAYLRL